MEKIYEAVIEKIKEDKDLAALGIVAVGLLGALKIYYKNNSAKAIG